MELLGHVVVGQLDLSYGGVLVDPKYGVVVWSCLVETERRILQLEREVVGC